MRSHRPAVVTIATVLLAWPFMQANAGPPSAVATEKLDDVRGGAEVVVNDMRLHGTVGDNAAINTFSGNNIVSEGSFSNAAGLPTVIQNSGNNVLIQNATILNVQFK
jgi:hypothetical protein